MGKRIASHDVLRGDDFVHVASRLVEGVKHRYACRVIRALRRQLKSAVFGAVPQSRLIGRGPPTRRRLALTFDDGPDVMTTTYLRALDDLGVPGTFFLVGQACEREPALVREYVGRGHQIAGHGYDHTSFVDLRWRGLREQLARTAAAIGPQPTERPWVRPPYGALNARVLGQLLATGITVALWSLDSLDFKLRDAREVALQCSPDRVGPGEIILLHEGQQWTLDALPRIVGGLREAGYEMVTMADLVSQ